MSNKNNTPEQKAQWKRNQKLGSRFIKIINSLCKYRFGFCKTKSVKGSFAVRTLRALAA